MRYSDNEGLNKIVKHSRASC